jgi:hypothetical protein
LKRIIIVQESDRHAGNKLGLLNPDTILIDLQKNPSFDKPALTESQKELWKLELENVENVKKLAGKDDIYYIEDGDPTQGIKHPAALVSTRVSDQITIAVSNSEPIYKLKNLKAAHYAVGTGAHNLGQGSTDKLITDQLQLKYPKIPINLCYHGLIHYGNFVVDFAHQAAKSPDDVTVGMFVYEIVNDKLLDIHQLTKTFDTRTVYYA